VDPKDAFFFTLFPGVAKCCDRELPPLSLWRLCSLEAIESVFICGSSEDEITPESLLLAIRALDCKYPETPSLLPTAQDIRWINRLRNDREFFEQEARTFIEYIKRHTIRPELWQNEGPSEMRPLTAPSALVAVTGLMKLGMTHTEAWATAPGYAQWLLLTESERQSDKVRFFRQSDLEQTPDDFEDMTEEQIIERAREVIPPEMFENWLEARRESHGRS
jgi:hypothetical protein